MATDDTPARNTAARNRLPWTAVLAATVLAAAAALLVILVVGGDDDAERGAEQPAPQGSIELTPIEGGIGDDPLAIDVEWPTEDDAHPLADELDGPAVVNFFASWCAPCVAEMPAFESVHQDLGESVDFFGIAVSDRTADATRIVEQTRITYPWARDERGDVANAARVTNMPATMFVDADGEVVSVHSGALDAGELRDLVEEHLGIAGGGG